MQYHNSISVMQSYINIKFDILPLPLMFSNSSFSLKTQLPHENLGFNNYSDYSNMKTLAIAKQS